MLAFKLYDERTVSHEEWHLDELELFPTSLLVDFKLEYDSDYPLGCRLVCRECLTPAFVTETYFPCLGRFVVTRCICKFGCMHHRWKLIIEPGERLEVMGLGDIGVIN